MALTPTPEQQAIIDAALDGKANLFINAYAGTAKTTTLEMVSHQAFRPGESVLYLVFNVKNKKEAEKRFASGVETLTANGLGHRAFGKAIGKRLIVEPRKLGTIVTATLKAARFDAATAQWAAVRETVTKAMQLGLVPSVFPHKSLVPDDEATWAEIATEAGAYDIPVAIPRDCLIASIKQSFAGTISYDDQIYMSALFGGVFPRFETVMVDESQDLSILNHIQVRRCAAGRLIVVGDPKQAIYQFRGADSASMEKLRALRPEWVDLPLATTFRCPKTIVARQRHHAPGFTAWHTNPEGVFRALPEGRPWHIAPGAEVAILCRNNAPLMTLAFKLLRDGVGCHMLGREIGKGLVALSRKICPEDATPIERCVELIGQWKGREISLALANGNEFKAEGITDRAECLLAVVTAAQAKTAKDLRTKLDELFSRDSARVTLSTGHRAKGLEWRTVIHLDPWRIPSRFARNNPVQMEQELNLKYVIETRAKETLVEANLNDYSREPSDDGTESQVLS